MIASGVVWSALATVLLATPSPPPRSREPAYVLRRTIPLPGDEGWGDLTMDPGRHRLYIPRARHVVVLDVGSEKVVGEVPDTPGVRGVALAPDAGRGFTSNGRDDSATVFDLDSLAPVGRLAVAAGPDAIVYDPPSRRVFVFGRTAGAATVVDAARAAAVGTVALQGRPVAAVSDGQGAIFVALEDKGEVVALDPAGLTIRARWPLAPCEGPAGLAVDNRSRRLLVSCRNKMMAVLDAGSGAVTATLAVGADAGSVAFDEDRGRAFVTAGDGTLTVAKEGPEGFAVSQVATTRPGSRTMALDPRRHRLYVGAARFGAPPAPTKKHPHPHGPMAPGSFTVLVLAR